MSSKSKTKRQSKHKESKIETKNLPPVKDAVREYRVIEDGAYAYHLQEEEIENHYSQNVNVRRLVQDDIRKAKELQDEEDRKAKILTVDEEQEVKQMDEELAEFIQEEIFKETVQEKQERKEREERDKELAFLMEETERRRADGARMHEEHDHQLAKQMQNIKVTPPGSRDDHDQRIRLMTDEDLAKRLQNEEKLKVERTKRRKDEVKTVVEMQDEELAKFIHDKEVKAAEWKLRKKEKEKKKSKKKGKWDNEPLFYDDNVNPPNFHELHGKPPPYEPQRFPPNGRHISPLDGRPRGDPRDDRRQRQQGQEEHRHRTDERRPDRPPPPMFSERHKTEVKVPLDDSQRRSNDRNLTRSSPGKEYSRDYESNPSHHQQRSYSERDRSSRESNGRSDMREHHRPTSEKHRGKPEIPYDPWKPREHEPHPKDKPREQRHSHGSRRPERPEARHSLENGQPTPKPRGSRSDPRSMPDPAIKKKHR